MFRQLIKVCDKQVEIFVKGSMLTGRVTGVTKDVVLLDEDTDHPATIRISSIDFVRPLAAEENDGT